MPLIEKRIIDNKTTLSIWEVSETEEQLLLLYPADQEEILLLNSFIHSFRRIQFLASRLLLHTVLPNAKIKYDGNGKPWLHQNDLYISLSHSSTFIALLISEAPCGIDIEIVRPKIERIVSKFLCAKEIEDSEGESQIERLHIYWCIKEAMYKVHGKKNVSLRTDIFVNKIENVDSGKVISTLNDSTKIESRQVFYQRFRNCMLAWTYSEIDEK